MDIEHFILPAIATIALGSALLLPLRDDRRGKRATVSGRLPLRVDFPTRDPAAATDSTTCRSGFASDEPIAESAINDESKPDASPRNFVRALRTFLGISQATPASASAVVPASDAPSDNAPPELGERSFAHELDAKLRAHERTLDAVPISEPSAEPKERAAPEADIASDEQQPAVFFESRQIGALSQSTSDIVTSHPHPQRIVPLTRRPLRWRATSITWPRALDDALIENGIEASDVLEDRSARCRVLTDLVERPDPRARAALLLAVSEEDATERTLALRALAELDVDHISHELFVETIRTGNDEERALALEVVARHGDRDALIRAFDDRVDAVAAKAALLYAATCDRRLFEAHIAPHVEGARLNAILAMLAGYLT